MASDDGKNTGPASPEINEREAEEIESRIAVSAPVVHEAIRHEGERELERPSSALAWSGLAAGLSMGFSFMVEGLMRCYLPDQPWRQLLVSLGYPVGFIVVIIGRQQLFTENTLTAIIPLLASRNLSTLLQVIRLWTVVLASNLAGAHVIAWVFGDTSLLAPGVRQALHDIALQSASVSPGEAILRGVFAGWLIALVVWLLAAADSRKLVIIAIPTYVVSLAQFTHVIVGSVEVLYLVMTGALAWTHYLTGYMLPTLLGNVIGGVALVSALNHAQVVAGKSARRS